MTDPTLSDEALTTALSHRTASTRALLARLQTLPSSSSSTPSSLELKTQSLLSTSLESREALRLLRESHARTLAELEDTHARLVKAEKRFDRYQSATVAAVEGRAVPSEALRAAASRAGWGPQPRTVSGAASPAAASPLPNGAVGPHGASGVKSEDGSAAFAASTDPSVQLGQPPGVGNGALEGELEELRDLVSKRAVEIEQLREERIGLKLEIDTMKGKVRSFFPPPLLLSSFLTATDARSLISSRTQLVEIPDEVVAETPTFRLMQQHVQYLAGEYDTKRLEADRAVKEAEELREGMEAFREGIFVRRAFTLSSSSFFRRAKLTPP